MEPTSEGGIETREDSLFPFREECCIDPELPVILHSSVSESSEISKGVSAGPDSTSPSSAVKAMKAASNHGQLEIAESIEKEEGEPSDFSAWCATARIS